MKCAQKVILWLFCFLLFLLFICFILGNITGHEYPRVFYRYLAIDHQLPMKEVYYCIRKTGGSSKYKLFYVLYRKNPMANGYDSLICFDSPGNSKEPFVTNINEEINLPIPAAMSGINKGPPFALYSTNEFLTPAYRYAVEAHTKSNEKKEESDSNHSEED